MKKLGWIVLGGSAIVSVLYLTSYADGEVNPTAEVKNTMPAATKVSSVKKETAVLVDASMDVVASAPMLAASTSAEGAVQSLAVSAEDNQLIWSEIETRLEQGEISVDLEKQLIAALRQHDDPKIYAAIAKRLQIVDRDLETRNQEYLLSLLAAINTEASVDLLLTTLTNTSVTDSNAIYVAKQSLQHIAQSSAYLEQLTEAFDAMASDNIFLPDVAKGIAAQAGETELAFLVAQAEANNDKTAVALASMASLSNEQLVPSLQQVINTRASDSPLTTTSLKALASMGQYEAAVALIQWSAKQPASSTHLVDELFETAGRRSPSTYRAIEKQLHRQAFSSAEVKAAIEGVYAQKP